TDIYRYKLMTQCAGIVVREKVRTHNHGVSGDSHVVAVAHLQACAIITNTAGGVAAFSTTSSKMTGNEFEFTHKTKKPAIAGSPLTWSQHAYGFIQNAVHELMAIVSSERFGQLNSFVDDNLVRHIKPVLQLIG